MSKHNGPYPKPLITRLLRKIKFVKGGCWLWLGAINSHGYGNILISNKPYRTGQAHRVSYELLRGRIPEGLLLCHTCDNRRCCNPFHIFIGTYRDNTQDAVRKNRMALGEKNGVAVLIESQIVEIRRLAAAGISQRAIAGKFGVSQPHVSAIVRRVLWTHVA